MKQRTTLSAILLVALFVTPFFATAAEVSGPAGDVSRGIGTFAQIVRVISEQLITAIIALLASAALAAFFFGIVKYIIGVRNGDGPAVKSGNQFMLWSVLALFVMFSVWGIITFAQGILGIQGRNNIIIPEIKFQRSGATTGPGTETPGGPLPDGTGPGTPRGGGGTVCAAATIGSDCTVAGRAGKCGVSEGEGVIGCYVIEGGGGGGSTPVGYCPDGTPYYDYSDRSRTCTSSSGTEIDCGAITDAESCTLVSCSWSDAYSSCSR